MRVFNQDKTKELLEYDLTKGYLISDKLFIKHHESIPEQLEKSHLEVVKTFPNGLKRYREVIDEPYQPAQEAYDEFEDIHIFVEYTQIELNEIEINKLKKLLASTDYKALKYAEGELTELEFAPDKAQRKSWREEINKLEEEINNLKQLNNSYIKEEE